MGVGKEFTSGYGLLYRSFDHGHMRKVCESINVSTLNKSLQRQLGRPAVSQDIRNFAETFQMLQEGRHLADYDPLTVFSASAAAFHVDAAEVAIQALDRTPPDEQADILALLMVRPRP